MPPQPNPTPAPLCLICDYALASLDPSRGGNCPECNFPIARSLRGDLLQDSPPAHLTRLRIGAHLIFWASLAPISIAARVLTHVLRYEDPSVPLIWTSFGALAVACFAFLAGWFLLTTRDPRSFTPRIESARRAARLAVLATAAGLTAIIVMALLQIIGGVFAARSTWLGYNPEFLFALLLLATFPTALAAMILSMLYLRRWSCRLPGRGGFIYKRARLIMWAWPTLPILQAVFLGGGQILLQSIIGPGSSRLFIIAWVILALTIVAFILLNAHLFYRTLRALKSVRRAQLAAAQTA